jgi:hypothetical protein
MWVEGDLYLVRVSTILLGERYTIQGCLTRREIEDANFDIISLILNKLETQMEMHLAKVSSS